MFKKIVLISCIAASTACIAEEKALQHEINYGLINLASLEWIDLDYSELPLFGLSYKYYFDPLTDSSKPYAIQSDLNRVSWASLDFNLFTSFAPNIGGHYFVNDQWSIEYDFIYESDDYSTSSITTKSSEFFIDTAVNYQISNNLQLGIGFRRVSENSEYRQELEDSTSYINSENSSENVVFIQTRYTQLENNIGWDNKISISTSDDYFTAKVYSTYYTSKNNGLTVGFLHQNGKSQFKDDITSLSFLQQYWFSRQTSIKYGFSWNMLSDVSYYGNDVTGSSSTTRFPLLEVSGTWRF